MTDDPRQAVAADGCLTGRDLRQPAKLARAHS